ncbi:hypothetical protein mRhiFer1_009953 [Rhinolophus ferrumequinum]|uniref:Uncharacterized protein n=1 Tax=Rhinolophus ferrumequinum TaxID=59479 RepID=A0A7J7YI65_RHIFE|nr:hypothetical protein mRhiFer1_009953 [Rhinolophus ferrumequinum]
MGTVFFADPALSSTGSISNPPGPVHSADARALLVRARVAHLRDTSILPSSTHTSVSLFIRGAAEQRWLRRVRAGVSQTCLASLSERHLSPSSVCLQPPQNWRPGSTKAEGESPASVEAPPGAVQEQVRRVPPHAGGVRRTAPLVTDREVRSGPN